MSSMEFNVATAPKTSTFQMRINPEIKRYAEEIFANCGMTLTEAVNAFIQQSINVQGLPFIVNQNSEDVLREQAIAKLLLELAVSEASAKRKGWLSEEEVANDLGVDL